eukprot:30925-Pelagococcus_subviridis.AAC.9
MKPCRARRRPSPPRSRLAADADATRRVCSTVFVPQPAAAARAAGRLISGPDTSTTRVDLSHRRTLSTTRAPARARCRRRPDSWTSRSRRSPARSSAPRSSPGRGSPSPASPRRCTTTTSRGRRPRGSWRRRRPRARRRRGGRSEGGGGDPRRLGVGDRQ